ncbi:hypothetical protein OJAV_G00021500 [Oryzias javanicus]|uniref:Uncharacterized protein n=1 Tax=Oryzias javanicus TaxID=123683 RepID=A0A3S2PFF2_ORYJA|nr:hypothetical protein OJAV_G00021500 [Oryzias javanicus]
MTKCSRACDARASDERAIYTGAKYNSATAKVHGAASAKAYLAQLLPRSTSWLVPRGVSEGGMIEYLQ